MSKDAILDYLLFLDGQIVIYTSPVPSTRRLRVPASKNKTNS